MRLRTKLVAAAAVAALAAGCGSDKCPTETPKIDGVGSCVAAPGQSVAYLVQLCPTCNLGGITCTVDLSGVSGSGGQIFLDPKAEACSSSTSCPSPSSCSADRTCRFAAPTQPADYEVVVYDPSTNGPKSGWLTVSTTLGATCL